MKGKTHGSPFSVRQSPIKVDITDVVCTCEGVVGNTVVVECALGVVIGKFDVVCTVVVSFSTTSMLGWLSTITQRRWRQESGLVMSSPTGNFCPEKKQQCGCVCLTTMGPELSTLQVLISKRHPGSRVMLEMMESWENPVDSRKQHWELSSVFFQTRNFFPFLVHVYLKQSVSNDFFSLNLALFLSKQNFVLNFVFMLTGSVNWVWGFGFGLAPDSPRRRSRRRTSMSQDRRGVTDVRN